MNTSFGPAPPTGLAVAAFAITAALLGGDDKKADAAANPAPTERAAAVAPIDAGPSPIARTGDGGPATADKVEPPRVKQRTKKRPKPLR